MEDCGHKDPYIERREYFRVEDVLPIMTRKLECGGQCVRARVFSGFFSGFGVSSLFEDVADETISPRLWKLLIDMNTKLGLILDKLYLDGEGLSRAESRPVSLSASGIRFSAQESYEIGDFLEIKMLIPVHPPVWIVAYGKVVRIDQSSCPSQRDIAIDFDEMDEEVTEVINHYTLKRQREMIRKQRGYD